ncbi:MAG: helicase-related protein [Elusimicrobiota bacterium]|nr:helicase-related protein [Elusimicrobiota bacterium]
MSNQFITNQERLLSDVINNILPSAAKLDFLVGYFYFSGFKEIYRNLSGKHVRILVGLDVEKDIVNAVRECELITERTISRGQIRDYHYKWLVKLYNETDFFDSVESQEAFRIFLEKIKAGSLEIKKTLEPNHAKLYIFENSPEFSQKGEYPGTVITGSSNLSRSGLRDRHEINVVFRDEHFKEAQDLFNELWGKAVTIADKNNYDIFHKEVIEKIWFEKLPSPYLMYIRVLDEYFSLKAKGEIISPKNIAAGMLDLKYQIDAVKQGLGIIKKHNGVIIADVVGLGKSIIASAITYNLKMKAVIIAPPHLCDQWTDYSYDFDLTAKIYSSGSIEQALEEDDGEEKIIIVDEAHKYRNENTEDYGNLHKLCQGKKVILLTATPFNNRPQDIFSMIRLFQIPAKSTIRTVDNLSYRFQELIREYKKIEKAQKEKSKTGAEIKTEVNTVARRIRDILSPVVIRRSRIDLEEIKEYKDDLALQKISFPEVMPPELATYHLGPLSELYIQTLEEISPESGKGGFQGVRYNPAHYLKEKHKLAYAEEFTGLKGKEAIGLLEQGQANLAIFMRRLLVRRFESSIYSFRRSLGSIIASSEKIKDYYHKLGKVPVYKKGDLPVVETLLDSTGEELVNIEEVLAKQLERGLHWIEKEKLEESFIKELEKDIELLKAVQEDWDPKAVKSDPKVEDFKTILKARLKEDPKRKIIVFTEFADTAAYLGEAIKTDFRVFKYSSADSSKENKKIIRRNFDASYTAEKQENNFDILVATDAMSEGINLHRAGIVFNYDMPYNPTRVIQRVGRINRVNKKVFDKLYIYNYFPTATGEDETRTKEISTLKIAMIHALMGEDTKYLTKDEDLKSFYKEQYEKFIKDDERSWDVEYRNLLTSLRSGRPELIAQADNIPPRTKIRRTAPKGKNGVLVFAQKGGEFTFSFGLNPQESHAMSPEDALKLFEALQEEKPQPLSKAFEPIYKNIKQNLFARKTQVPFDKGKREAADKVRFLMDNLPTQKDYLEDLLTVIEKLDSLPAHYLKLIRSIAEKTLNADFAELQKQVPHKYLTGLLNQANKVDEGEEILILVEEF